MTRHLKALAVLTAGLMFLAGAATALAVDLPYSGSDMRLWLTAETGMTVDEVTHINRLIGWADQIGKYGNATAQDGTGPSGERPLWQADRIGGRPSLWFDTTLRQVIGDAVLPGADGARTILVVGLANSTGNATLFDPNGQGSGATVFRITPEMGVRFGNGNKLYESDTLGTTPAVVGAQLPAGGKIGDTEMFFNSATPLTATGVGSPTNAVATGTAGYQIGRDNFLGEIAEVMVFESALSSADMTSMIDYLTTKYSIGGASAPTDVVFDNLGVGNDWSTAENWDTAAEPSTLQNAHIGSGLTALITEPGEVAQNVFVGETSGSSKLDIDSGSLTVGTDLNLGNGGFTGNAEQDGGTVSVGQDLVFGATGNKGGTYNLDGGTLSVGRDIVETTSAVDGAQLHIDGGTLTVGGDITVQRFAVAQDGGTTGNYAIAAGQSVESTGTTAVGSNGTGTLDVTAAGASLKSSNAVVGEGGNGNGTVTIGDGNTWEVTQFLRIGNNGKAKVEVKSGVLDIKGTSGNPRGLRLAENAAVTAAKKAELILGTDAGSGVGGVTVNVSGGNTETANAGVGEIIMYHGTFNQITNNIIVSQAAGSDATFTMYDGLVDIENQLRFNAGTGLFTQNGGTVNVGTVLDIANNPTSDGTYRMYGGVLNAGDRVNSDLKIGNHNTAAAKATMEIIDGTVNVSKSIRIADVGVNSSGTLIVGDGTTSPIVNLNTAAGGNFETADDGKGTFTLKSGTVNVQNSNLITGQAVNSEATVAIGGFAAAATLNVEGGDNNRDWNTNGGHGIVDVLAGGTVNVARNMNLGNNTDANSGLELTIDGGTVNVGTKKAAGGTIDYRNNGPKDNIALLDGVLNLNGGTINLRGGPTTLFDLEGGTLLDVGQFLGTLTQNGGTLAAGASPGTMAISGDYLFNLGTLEVEINDPFDQGQDPGYDFYDVAGNAVLGNTLAAGDGPAVLDVKLLSPYNWIQGDYFDVLEATSITINDDFVFDAGANGGVWTYEVIPGAGGNSQVLRITADVPEPATLLVWSLLAAAGLGLGWRRRR